MCPAAVLGDRSTGKTTFLTLLYNRAVIKGTRSERDFLVTPHGETFEYFKEAYARMSSGRFPGATVPDEENKIHFTFGYANVIRRYNRLDFHAFDVSGEEVEEYVKTRGRAVSSRAVQQLIQSKVLVILADASKMNLDPDSVSRKKLADYDSQVGQLVQNLIEYNAHNSPTRKVVLFPVITFTKYDMLPPDVFGQLKLSTTLPPPSKKGNEDRHKLGETLMQTFLPRTLANLNGGSVFDKGVDMTKWRRYYFSYVREATAAGGLSPVTDTPSIKVIPADTKENQGFPNRPDYPLDEYDAFIEYFREIAPKAE